MLTKMLVTVALLSCLAATWGGMSAGIASDAASLTGAMVSALWVGIKAALWSVVNWMAGLPLIMQVLGVIRVARTVYREWVVLGSGGTWAYIRDWLLRRLVRQFQLTTVDRFDDSFEELMHDIRVDAWQQERVRLTEEEVLRVIEGNVAVRRLNHYRPIADQWSFNGGWN